MGVFSRQSLAKHKYDWVINGIGLGMPAVVTLITGRFYFINLPVLVIVLGLGMANGASDTDAMVAAVYGAAALGVQVFLVYLCYLLALLGSPSERFKRVMCYVILAAFAVQLVPAGHMAWRSWIAHQELQKILEQRPAQ